MWLLFKLYESYCKIRKGCAVFSEYTSEFPFLTDNETAKTLSSCYFLISDDSFSKGLYYDFTLLFPIASYIVVVELI